MTPRTPTAVVRRLETPQARNRSSAAVVGVRGVTNAVGLRRVLRALAKTHHDPDAQKIEWSVVSDLRRYDV